jgi:hypothetical protein
MNQKGRTLIGFGISLAGALAIGLSVRSQEVHTPINVPHDWSHRHLIFSGATTLQDSVHIQGDLRYWHQLRWREAARVPEPANEIGKDVEFSRIGRRRVWRHPDRQNPMHQDWGMSLGPNATTGSGMFPAKFSFDISTANCGNATSPDYVVFGTSLASASNQAAIVAFDNLYTGCTGIVPTVYWGYQTTATGDNCTNCLAATSPVLSQDGSQVAFVGSSGGGAFLYILKPKAGEGTVGVPVQPTTSTTTAATYVTCRSLSGPSATSCLLSLPLGANNNTNSPPFYNYAFDMLYVGDDQGMLYKFTGVFRGTPTKVTTGGWPMVVHSGFKLTAPVYDQSSGNAYVADSGGVLSFVRDTASTVGACSVGNPPCLGNKTVTAGAGNPIVDAPIVDSTTQRVLVSVGNDGSGNSGVFQAPTDLSSHVEATVGPQFGNTLYDGAFDNAYFTSVGSGHLYTCENISTFLGLSDNVALARIGFNATGLMNGSADATSLTLTNTFPLLGAVPTCSPATEISSSASSDLIFLSVTASAAGCGGNGCIMSVSLPTATPFTFPTAISHTLAASGGTSGIIVDNIATTPTGASQIYFTPLGNSSATFPCGSPSTNGVGCAIQTSQAGLQ